MKYIEQESSTVELKEKIPTKDQILKTIIGFCNRYGGKLIIGVRDNGDIIGVDESTIQEQMEFLDKMIYDASAPPILPSIYIQSIDDKLLLIIEVSQGMKKPYYIKSKGLEKGTYVRLGRSTLNANADMIEELKWSSRGRFYDQSAIYHASYDDLDSKAIDKFFSLKKGSTSSSINSLLQSYTLIVEEHKKIYPTVAGILLFGKEPGRYLPEAFILASHFSGISGRDAIASLEIQGDLFEQFERAFSFIHTNLTKSFYIKGAKRKEILEIPEIAIREVLLNAIVHRNYHIMAPIKIAIYDNRLEIFSPGDFPGPINQNNLLMGLTYIRNPSITKVFRKAGYIEKLGSGFKALFDSYENAKLPPPEVVQNENFIKCILPRPSTTHSITVENSHDLDHKILSLFNQASRIKISDVMKIPGISRSTAGRKLQHLVTTKQLIKIGNGKSTEYELFSTHSR